jgi:hypothetical protein
MSDYSTIRAGLETDLLIINELMKWRQKDAQDEKPTEHPFFEVVKDKIVLHRKSGWVTKGWSPSTQFDDAIEVAKEMRQRGYKFESYPSVSKGSFYAIFSRPDKEMPYALDSSVQLAICKAALMTISKDNDPPKKVVLFTLVAAYERDHKERLL